MGLNISSLQDDTDLHDFILAAIAVEVFVVVFFNQCKIYDLATAAFFAWCLGFLARGRIGAYLGAFALANINRETTIFLALVFMVYFFSRMEWRRYLALSALQLVIFMATRAGIMALFADHPGDNILIRPIENIQLFLQSPAWGLAHWALITLVLWLCLRRWRSAHSLLRTAFLVMAPALLVLYLVAGWAFEVRVFAEVYPVIWAILWSSRL
jgi:hypothetical protein